MNRGRSITAASAAAALALVLAAAAAPAPSAGQTVAFRTEIRLTWAELDGVLDPGSPLAPLWKGGRAAP